MPRIKRAVFVGTIIGVVMGFIDTYGYAVTGYTTAELSLVITPVLVMIVYRLIMKSIPSPSEQLLASLVAVGSSLSTTITSGMYITYTMLATMVDPDTIGLPQWLYYSGALTPMHYLFYVFAAASSLSGVLLAYAFSEHFITRERLQYPIGVSASLSILVSRTISSREVILVFVSGLVTELSLGMLGFPLLDLTPSLQGIIPGMAFAAGTDIIIFLLALMLPLSVTAGVALGSFAMFLIVLPILAFAGIFAAFPGMSVYDIVSSAAPAISSFIVGYVALITAFYFLTYRKVFLSSLKFIMKARETRIALIIALIIQLLTIVLAAIPTVPNNYFPQFFIPVVFLVSLLLSIVTMRMVGETGTASQALLPLGTASILASGARGAMPYVLADPYTGVPMPQFMAGTGMNMIKATEKVGASKRLAVGILGLSVLLFAPLTLLYGHILLSTYGISSPRLNLSRWIPIVAWMSSLYSGGEGSIVIPAAIAGAVAFLSVLILTRTLKSLAGLSTFAFLLGTTLTPDVGLLFAAAALIKFIAYRMGTDVYEALLAYASIALSGAGAGIMVTTVMSALGVA